MTREFCGKGATPLKRICSSERDEVPAALSLAASTEAVDVGTELGFPISDWNSLEESRRSEMKKPVPRLVDGRTSFGVECTGFSFPRSVGLEVVSVVAVLGASSCGDVLHEA